jgi:two-component sensor histidine kinase
MSTAEPEIATSDAQRAHLGNVADNLQLVADLSFADVALLVPEGDSWRVVADARPATAVPPFPASRAGSLLAGDECPECRTALELGRPVAGDGMRRARGANYTTLAWPLGVPVAFAAVVRSRSERASAPGAMESAFMGAADELLAVLAAGPLLDLRDERPFATTRHAGDGVLLVGESGSVAYASPNAVGIMRAAGVEGRVTGAMASTLPGAVIGISPALGAGGALAVQVDVAERVLHYRSIALPQGVLALVEDLTEARRAAREIQVQQATIREVHHRVKNNLQTVASLLRIHARRVGSDEARHALAEATDRVASMALVHDLLAGSDEERVDFAEVATRVVDLVRHGLVGEESRVEVAVGGATGEVDARTATSLAVAVAELVHNALEHAFPPGAPGAVRLDLGRRAGQLEIAVRDDGRGLPAAFDLAATTNLGLAIVRALVEDDLRGTLTIVGDNGTTVTVRVPLADDA